MSYSAEDLSFVADALLALCEPQKERPYYTEESFETKLRHTLLRESRADFELENVRKDVVDKAEFNEILDEAHLTALQYEVVVLRLDGWTFEEIGKKRKKTKQAAQRVFVQALKKLRRAMVVYPFSGLRDVYRWEINRGRNGTNIGRMRI